MVFRVNTDKYDFTFSKHSEVNLNAIALSTSDQNIKDTTLSNTTHIITNTTHSKYMLQYRQAEHASTSLTLATLYLTP